METAGKILRCSFCGKSQGEVVKLIAGPTVYICNECVVVCDQILDDEGIERDPVSQLELAKRHLARAASDLEGARLLIAHEHYRLAVDVLRGAIRACLQGYFIGRDGQCYMNDLTKLLSQTLHDEEDLRRLEGINLTDLLADLEFDEDVNLEDVQHALSSSETIVQYIRGRVEAA
jgi:hypothetical protein